MRALRTVSLGKDKILTAAEPGGNPEGEGPGRR